MAGLIPSSQSLLSKAESEAHRDTWFTRIPPSLPGSKFYCCFLCRKDHSEILFHASTPTPGGTRIALTLDIKGRVMGLLKPSAGSVQALVLLFPEAAVPGAHGLCGAFVPGPELATSRYGI